VRDLDPRVLADRPDPMKALERRASDLAREGFANRFGPQRFGRDGANAERGRALLRNPRRRRARDDLMLSAWQSALFERWIDARLALGPIGRPLAGDLLRVEGTGGLFASQDPDEERARAARGEITPTGPLFGARMRRPSGPADELERALLHAEDVGEAELSAARLPGARRAARVVPEELVCAVEPGGLRLAFTLAKGAYATVLVEALLGRVRDASAYGPDV
jgi:tRNA pseudouridine13 synthase